MRIHFRIEFDFRNGHQFTSILNYNTRSKVAFDFADKILLMAVNIAKALLKESDTNFSVYRIKPVISNTIFNQQVKR